MEYGIGGITAQKQEWHRVTGAIFCGTNFSLWGCLPPKAALAPLPKGGWQIADFRQFDWGIS
jgi:hypothetical protein